MKGVLLFLLPPLAVLIAVALVANGRGVASSSTSAWVDATPSGGQANGSNPYPVDGVSPTGPQASSSAGLVAYWSMDEGTGDAVSDASGNGNDGTRYGPAWISGQRGSALDFDGTDDYVEVADDDTLDLTSGATVMAWVRVSSATGDHQIIAAKWYEGESGCPPCSYVFEFQPAGVTPQFVTYTTVGRQDAISGVTVDLGEWAFLAGTYDGSVARIYVNGVPTGEIGQSGSIQIGAQPLLMGAHAASWDRNWLEGAIDEVRIFNRALTAQEIQQYMYLAPVGGIATLPEPAGDPGSSATSYVLLTTVGAAVLASLAAAASYARRRWLA
jgi:hypothetical protein